MQCKDIPTEPILRFLAQHQGRWATWHAREKTSSPPSSSLTALLSLTASLGLPPGEPMPTVRDAMSEVPDKLALAKMRQLRSKGLVSGCPCGCRGDFEITEAGLERLAQLKRLDAPDTG